MRINRLDVAEISQSENIKDYAVFIYLKTLYRNSCVYKYTDQRLAGKQLTGGGRVVLSRSSIRKYVKLFLDKGWCRMHKGNLIFNQIALLGTAKKRIYVTIPNFKKSLNPIKEIIDFLYYNTLKLKQSQFEYLKSAGLELNNPSYDRSYKYRKSRRKTLTKLLSAYGKAPNETDQFTVSMKGIGKILNCSAPKACRIIKRLKKYYGIKVWATTRFEWIGMNEKAMIEARMGRQATYTKGKFLFFVSPNRYDFINV